MQDIYCFRAQSVAAVLTVAEALIVIICASETRRSVLFFICEGGDLLIILILFESYRASESNVFKEREKEGEESLTSPTFPHGE